MNMKKFFLLIFLTAMFLLPGYSIPEKQEVSSNLSYSIDYKNAELFENDLNSGINVDGKIVKFEVNKYVPNSILGINCWAGNHLNFVSKEALTVESGDFIVGKVTAEPTKILFESWKIKYEVLDIIPGMHTSSEFDVAGTTADAKESHTKETSCDFHFEKEAITVTEEETFEIAYSLSDKYSLDTLIFHVDHPDILQRNEDGTYTALKPGTATVTVYFEDYSCSSCLVNIEEMLIPPEQIVFKQDELEVAVGSVFELDYEVFPENASDVDIEVSISSEAITQNTNRTFFAADAGKTTISFYQGNRLLGFCTVYSSIVKVEKVVFADSTTELFIGETIKLPFTLLPESANDAGLTIASKDPKVANVEFGGHWENCIVVHGISAGSTTIEISESDGKKFSHSIIVSEVQPSEIILTNSEPDSRIEVGDNISLDVTWNPTNTTTKKLTWASSNSNVIRVTQEGVLQAVGIGKADITAKHKSGTYGVITLHVDPTLVKSISLITDGAITDNLVKGARFTITPELHPKNATNQSLLFTSSDESVLTVTSRGLVTAVGPGTASINATSPDGPSTSLKFTVKPAPQNFRITWTASLISNDHVGGNWSKTFEVNGNSFASGSTIALAPDSSLTLRLTIIENDKRPDTGSYYEKVPYSIDLCKNGYSISGTIYVTENSGRYSGHQAQWQIRINITPV